MEYRQRPPSRRHLTSGQRIGRARHRRARTRQEVRSTRSFGPIPRTGHAGGGDQLPTVPQLAVDLSINPNTVVRAYRELEIRGILTTQQGIGTFVTTQPVPVDEAVRQRQLDQLIGDLLARAGAAGLKADEIVARLQEFINEQRGLS